MVNSQPPSEDKKTATSAAASPDDENQQESEREGPLPLVDELGVQDLTEVLFADRGRIFSAAGRESPIAELGAESVLLRPADKPFEDDPPVEVISVRSDDRGVLLDELGNPRRIVGAKYKGQPIYQLAEQMPDSIKHFAAWFDENNRPHKFYVNGQALTTDTVFRIRNRTIDGEISTFAELSSD